MKGLRPYTDPLVEHLSFILLLTVLELVTNLVCLSLQARVLSLPLLGPSFQTLSLCLPIMSGSPGTMVSSPVPMGKIYGRYSMPTLLLQALVMELVIPLFRRSTGTLMVVQTLDHRRLLVPKFLSQHEEFIIPNIIYASYNLSGINLLFGIGKLIVRRMQIVFSPQSYSCYRRTRTHDCNSDDIPYQKTNELRHGPRKPERAEYGRTKPEDGIPLEKMECVEIVCE